MSTTNVIIAIIIIIIIISLEFAPFVVLIMEFALIWCVNWLV